MDIYDRGKIETGEDDHLIVNANLENEGRMIHRPTISNGRGSDVVTYQTDVVRVRSA